MTVELKHAASFNMRRLAARSLDTRSTRLAALDSYGSTHRINP
jgi:hypothetical protein